MDDLNLSRLRAFVIVAEELSFTRAAARLHVAQQPLSATIRRLERDVGVRLFDRSTRTVSLNPAGHALLRRTRRALDELTHGVADARRVDRHGRGNLAVGVMAGAALELTEPILAACAVQLPDSRPVAGLARSEVALGWRTGERNPRVHRFVSVALATVRAHPSELESIEAPA